MAAKIRAEKLDAFYGPPVPPDSMLSVYHAPNDRLWTPYAGFPLNWSSARILRKLVEAYHREETEDVAKRLQALGAVVDDDPEAQRLRTLQRELSMLRSKISNAFFPTVNAGLKEYDAPPVEVKEQILALLEDLRTHGMPSSRGPCRQTIREHSLDDRSLLTGARVHVGTRCSRAPLYPAADR